MATVLERSSCAMAALVALLLPGAARADDILPPPAPAEATASETAAPPPATRRSSFAVGAMVGAGAASIVGYPNDLTRIGYASWYTATGARPAAAGVAWIGGAITDWLTLSLGFTATKLFATGGNQATSLGGLLRVEAFPLFPLGGHLRDLGVFFEAGPCLAMVTDPSGNSLVDSSLASIVGGGVFYEGIRAWKVAQGPYLMGDYLWSDTALRPGVFAGWRVSLYTKP